MVCAGKAGEAAELHQQVLESQRKQLGPDHPDTLTSLGHLASCLQDQGKLMHVAAIAMVLQMVFCHEVVLGRE